MLADALQLDPSKRKVLKLALHQLCDLDDLHDLLSKKEAADVQSVDLSTNSFLEVDPALTIFTQLESLDLHLNLISCIEHLESFPHLAELNLSHNQITQIENLSALPHLAILVSLFLFLPSHSCLELIRQQDHRNR